MVDWVSERPVCRCTKQVSALRKSSVAPESELTGVSGLSFARKGYVEEGAQTWLRSRRMLTLALLLAAALLGDPTSAKDKTAGTEADRQDASLNEIRLGMSADFSASARALSIELYRGAMAYLLPLNNAGGVNGRRVVIKAYDDQYEPDLAIRNTLKLMAEDVFALFSYVGTPTMNRTLPLLRMHHDKDFLLFFPFTGADTNRIPPYDQLSFNLRASYVQEMKGLVDHFVAVNRTRIAVFYQADAYGRAGWAGLREALDEHGLEIAGEATYRRGSPFDQSYDRQVAIMQRLQPDAVVCVGTYLACAGFVRDMRDRGVDCPVATISFVGGGAMLKLLSAAERESNKDYTSRLVSSQVVPSYNDDSVPAVREYREAMDRYRDAIMPPDSLLYPHGKTAEREYAPLPYGFISLEGYLNAKLFMAILQRMGADPRRADLAATVLAMGDFDLGIGQPLSFGGDTARRQASDQVYYTVVKDGRFVPFRDGEWEAWAKR
jgi:branched-chain amino acid transport system substrate-binding protein